MAQAKKLYRLPADGQIAGVAAGLADYLDIDVTLLRLIFVVLIFVTGGFMLVVYFIMALVLPTPDSEATLTKDSVASSLSQNATKLSSELQQNKGIGQIRNYLGIFLIFVGAWLLLQQLFPGFWALSWSIVWPLILVVTGLLIVSKRGE